MAFLADAVNGTTTLDKDHVNFLKGAFRGTVTDETFTLKGLTDSYYESGDAFFFEHSGLAYVGANCYWNGSNWVRKTNANPARLFEFDPASRVVKVYTVASGGGRTYETSLVTLGIEGATPRNGEIVQSNGKIATAGDAQTSVLVARCQTTSAGDTDLTLDGASPTTSNTVTIAENKAFAFQLLVMARRDDGSEFAAWKAEGIISRTTGGDATISGDSVTAIGTPPSGWAFALYGDVTNQALEMTATSPAAINIDWVGRVTLVEVS